jgi:hypothetical protein
VRSHRHVYAWPAASIDHLALSSDAESVTANGTTARGPRVPLVRVRDQIWPVFDLGKLLGEPLTPSSESFAWLLARVPVGRPLPLPVALRVGACLAVRQLRRLTHVPDALLTVRATALQGMFTAADVAGGLGAERLGFVIDPAGLLALEERQSAIASLDEAGAWSR